MSTDQAIQLAAAIGTFVVAVLAIWSDPIKHALGIRPRLRLALHDPMGELIEISEGDGLTTPARYYHIRVSNSKKWIQARNVRISIVGLAKPAADGAMIPQQLVGPLQLFWRFDAYHPPSSVVGPDDICDLGFLKEGEHFRLTPIIAPNNFPGALRAGQSFVVELKALADNAESPSICIGISWDGNWILDTELMSHSLVVKEVQCLTEH